jgi:hypothetical protein
MTRHPEKMAEVSGDQGSGGRTAPGELRVIPGLLKDDDGEGAQLAPMPGLADSLEPVGSCWRLSSPAAS